MKKLCNLIVACALLVPQAALAAKLEQPGYPPPPPPGHILTMQDTIYGVLRTHRTLRSLLENQQVLTHEVSRARAGFGPRVDLEGKAGGSVYSDSSTRRSGLDQQMWGYVSGSAKLVQPIWDGFATRSRVRSARSTLESVQSRVFDTATSLSLDGIIAHIDLIRRREIMRLSEKNVQEHKSVLGMVQEREVLGAKSTEADVKQAQARLQRALSSESEAKAALLIAEETYHRLTGLTPGNMQSVSWPPDVFTESATVFELAEKHNPKLAAYMKDIRAARADRELAESAFYPVFNAEVGPSYSDRGGARDRWIYSFDVLGTVRWNVFNSGADVAEWKAASARMRQARQIMYNYIDDLKLDIDTTWANYKAAEEQFKHYNSAKEFNAFTKNAYWEQYLEGRGERSLLDVLDSINELYNSSTQTITCWGNILVGAYRLTALTGNMLPSMSIDTGPLKDAPPVDADDSREKFDLGWFN